MKKGQRWETRPLECWNRAKELRREYQETAATATETGVFLIDGGESAIFSSLEGPVQSVLTNPLASMMAFQSNQFTRKARAATECYGFGRDICGYHKNVYGAMILNEDISGKPFPRRSLSIVTPAPCDEHAKRPMPVSDFYDTPRFPYDTPIYMGKPDSTREEAMGQYKVNVTLAMIAWLEKVTGWKFNDEKYAETMKSTLRLRTLAGEVICLMQNVPTPMDQKSFQSFMTLGGRVATDVEKTEALWRELRDELKWRVQNKVAALATERYRWMEHMPPPWFFLRFYRYLENYGAVCVGSPYTHAIGGPYEWRKDGTFGPKPSPLDMGMPMKTREDIVRANVLKGPMSFGLGCFGDIAEGSGKLTDMAKAFHCDGAIFALWRAGVGCVYGRMEDSIKLRKMGVNVMHYEGSQAGERTDLDEMHMLNQIDYFMENQGLRKLED